MLAVHIKIACSCTIAETEALPLVLAPAPAKLAHAIFEGGWDVSSESNCNLAMSFALPLLGADPRGAVLGNGDVEAPTAMYHCTNVGTPNVIRFKWLRGTALDSFDHESHYFHDVSLPRLLVAESATLSQVLLPSARSKQLTRGSDFYAHALYQYRSSLVDSMGDADLAAELGEKLHVEDIAYDGQSGAVANFSSIYSGLYARFEALLRRFIGDRAASRLVGRLVTSTRRTNPHATNSSNSWAEFRAQYDGTILMADGLTYPPLVQLPVTPWVQQDKAVAKAMVLNHLLHNQAFIGALRHIVLTR